MAKTKITKRFDLTPEAAAELERLAKANGVSQTAFVEALILRLRGEVVGKLPSAFEK